MEWGNEGNRAEWVADTAAAAAFAAAVAFAAGALGAGAGPTIFVAALASLGIYSVLRNVAVGERIFELPAFEPAPFELVDDALLLEDRLRTVDPDARVIRLFDPRHMPAADSRSGPVHADAAQALTQALEDLRRSLR